MERGLSYTAADLLALPDQDRFELVRGELTPMPPPSGGKHGFQTLKTARYLDSFATQNQLGTVLVECGFCLAREPDTIRAPDVMFYKRGRLAETPDGYLEVVPDLAVEVASPSKPSTYLEEKVQQYFLAGVSQVWVLYPRTQTIHRFYPDGRARVLRGPETLDGEELLPGFTVSISEFFSEHLL